MKLKLIVPGECSSRINDHRLVIWCSATVPLFCDLLYLCSNPQRVVVDLCGRWLR